MQSLIIRVLKIKLLLQGRESAVDLECAFVGEVVSNEILVGYVL